MPNAEGQISAFRIRFFAFGILHFAFCINIIFTPHLEHTVTTHSDLQALPLTRLSEDERLFRDSVYEFADREIRPLVREMDEQAKIPKQLIEKLFELGAMGIEIPETYGGGGATFFHSSRTP